MEVVVAMMELLLWTLLMLFCYGYVVFVIILMTKTKAVINMMNIKITTAIISGDPKTLLLFDFNGKHSTKPFYSRASNPSVI